jgi:hypothetical protein
MKKHSYHDASDPHTCRERKEKRHKQMLGINQINASKSGLMFAVQYWKKREEVKDDDMFISI